MRKDIIKYVLVIIIVLFPFVGLVFDFICDGFPYARRTDCVLYMMESADEKPEMLSLGNRIVIREDFSVDSYGTYSFDLRYIVDDENVDNEGIVTIKLFERETGKLLDIWEQDLGEIKEDIIISYPLSNRVFHDSVVNNNYTVEIVGVSGSTHAGLAYINSRDGFDMTINDIPQDRGIQFSVMGVSGRERFRLSVFWLRVYLCVVMVLIINRLFISSGKTDSE